MSAPTVAVTVTLSSQDGTAYPGVLVTAKLDKNDIYQGFVISGEVAAVTNAQGIAVLNLFPNHPAIGLGTTGSVYLFKAAPTGGKALRVVAQIPNKNCRLEDVANIDIAPGLNDAQAALAAAQGSVALASAQATISTAQAVLADNGRIAAETAAAQALTRSVAAALSRLDAVNAATAASASATAAQTSGSAITLTGNLAASTGSALVGFTASGAGATPRTLQSKQRDIVSVKDFGAIGNGVADDYPTCQAAADSFIGTITGGIVYMPRGIYKFSSGGLDFGDKQNMYLKGEGSNATVIQAAATVNVAVNFGLTGSATGTSYQGIYDLRIECLPANVTTAVRIQNNNTFTFNNITIERANIGLLINGGVIQYYTNFVINLSITVGIKIVGGNDQFFKHGVLSSIGSPEPAMAGIWCAKSDAFWLDSVDCIAQKVGLLLAPQGTDYISWLFVSNCAFDTATGNGIQFSPAVGALVKGCTFTGCWSSTNNVGVYIDGAGRVDGVRFVGHRSFNNGKSGYIVSGAGARNISFNDSDASGNSTSGPGVYSGFDIGAGVSKFSIIDCRSGAQSDFPSIQSRGILVNPGDSNDYIIMGNDVMGNVNNSILDLGTGANKIVKSNLGYNPLPLSTVTVTASPFTYTNNTGDAVNLYVTGGAVSLLTVLGKAIGGSTNIMVPLPQGAALTITYSTAPAVTVQGY